MIMKKSTKTLVLFFVATAFVALVVESCKPKQASKEEKFIGLQLYSLRDAMKADVPDTVASVGQIGYKFVEAAGYGDGKFYGMAPSEFVNLCEINKLKFLGSHTGQGLPDSTNWDKTMAWWDEAIEAHSVAGVSWIVQPWMGKEGYESLEGLKKYCEYFNAVGEKCNAKGIRFGYHNHDKEFSTLIEGKPVYNWMLELTNPAYVMFQIDLYWAVVGGKDPVEYFNSYPGRFELWHIKDKQELGVSGMMNFEAIWVVKEKSGVKYGIVEVEEYNFEPAVSCQKSLDFLNNAAYVKM